MPLASLLNLICSYNNAGNCEIAGSLHVSGCALVCAGSKIDL